MCFLGSDGSHVWDELAAGVFRRRYASLDLNIGLVLGENGALVIDTRAAHKQAEELLADISAVTKLPVRWVVNTHWHWDHVFGNALFPGAEVWGHRRCREHLLQHGEDQRLAAIDYVGEANRSLIEEVEIVPPAHIVDPVATIDVGGRTVTVEWLGHGHTDADVVLSVSEASVLFVGDLLESGAPPYFGDGYPLAWQDTAGRIRERAAGITVPGHGDVMSIEQVATQHQEIAAVAAACAEGLATGLFDAEVGPYPAATMADAWRRAKLEAGFSS